MRLRPSSETNILVEIAMTFDALSKGGTADQYKYFTGYPDSVLDQCEVLQSLLEQDYSCFEVNDDGKLVHG